MLAFQERAAPPRLARELENMCIDPWTVGNFNVPIETGAVVHCFVWMRLFRGQLYAHPVEGIHPIVDVTPWKCW